MERKISVIGLGYVGMPLAIAFAKKSTVIGFDINNKKIEMYKKGIDITNEVGDEAVKNSTVEFTCDEIRLREADFHIVAVPTPTNDDKTPDLRPVIGASRVVGRNLTKGSIVVYESTVYPGVTEEVCIPILEEESGLKCGQDFKVGYSPERINPGDKIHRLENIVKIVSGMDEETLDIVAKVYELVIEAGVYRAESIKVAEAAKVIENSQRDVNIAFVNELSIIFDKMGIDTKAVIKAAGSKWNFMKFNPGLVGGHCIGVDPYYLIHRAKELGVESRIIAAGRAVNDGMAKHVAENTVKSLIKANKRVKGAKVAVLGITFKQDCSDTRNTKVIDIVNELKEYDMNVIIADPVANVDEVREEYEVELIDINNIFNVDVIILAVAHNEYRKMSVNDFSKLYKQQLVLDEVAVDSNISLCEKNVFIDIKGIVSRKSINVEEFVYWRL
ncbi:nucleotide sugar dehydrogenase [Clostridium perfringens]|uniref:nucleotide sugar dehydrogenase n=1 Tax=Clostridium perfringens TaxID=1502 RepID=UPI0018E3FAC9|nr:nucleotide sugar dehydrogenase [Clostridium perfringens]MBI6037000.1 nucleotide sugar dehydrogenase [Clostridium perfringens]MDK0598018.1 nucleotide sugar dehydrogenase [Clostridium perfringens]MDK0945219.1 nucleotide sugar dehydrogenase [Clostridium perfringens]MDK0964978.1 nucleotide sugar dehydrogenase [Clostridium perfringens]MDK0970794.1 nucleotide sugar dehydrogenase [Clostridium perfringens]